MQPRRRLFSVKIVHAEGSVLSEAAGGCLFAVKLVNFILSLPENIE